MEVTVGVVNTLSSNFNQNLVSELIGLLLLPPERRHFGNLWLAVEVGILRCSVCSSRGTCRSNDFTMSLLHMTRKLWECV